MLKFDIRIKACLHEIDRISWFRRRAVRVTSQRNFNGVKFAQSACTVEIDERHRNAHVE